MQQFQKGWHTRGYLPHFDASVSQFVTFRLYDSLPQSILRKLKFEHENDKLYQYDPGFQLKIEEYLDKGIGSCYLRRLEIARMVMDALIFYRDKHYKLFAWVIMPNHVHILIRPLPEYSLSQIMKNLKGFTARKANMILGRNGPFWQTDYFDRFIRDEQHFLKTVDYIENNPVKAKLCESVNDWEFSSSRK